MHISPDHNLPLLKDNCFLFLWIGDVDIVQVRQNMIEIFQMQCLQLISSIQTSLEVNTVERAAPINGMKLVALDLQPWRSIVPNPVASVALSWFWGLKKWTGLRYWIGIKSDLRFSNPVTYFTLWKHVVLRHIDICNASSWWGGNVVVSGLIIVSILVWEQYWVSGKLWNWYCAKNSKNHK